jgi:hypothetical protein
MKTPTRTDLIRAAHTRRFRNAMALLMSKAGITNSDVVDIAFCDFDWEAANPEDRLAKLVWWLDHEREIEA